MLSRRHLLAFRSRALLFLSRALVLLLAAIVFAFCVRLAWLAFTYPVEIEVREGSVWLHVLAKRAGVDIYDPSRVAFVNMNHGPMDPIVKTWIATIFPGLPGNMVIRAPVLACPFFLFGAAYVITRRNLAGSLFAAGALYLFCVHVSRLLLVGRSDATTICGLSICGLLTHQLLVRQPNWSGVFYLLRHLALGTASAFVFLTSWRYLPVLAALQFVLLAKQLGTPPILRVRVVPGALGSLMRVWGILKNLLASMALYAVGFLALWLPVFLLELHGDAQMYYRRFFGFFSAQSGWGTFAGAKLQLLPEALIEPRPGLAAAALFLLPLGLFRLRKSKLELGAWLVMLAALWLTVSYGYYKNQGGGGLHYFFEFFLFAWIFLLHTLCRRSRRGTQAQLILVVAVTYLLPLDDLRVWHRQISEARERAVAFRASVAQHTRGEPVFGEETHLFKDKYSGELVDTGDAAAVIARSGYFGEEFTKTYRSYLRQLTADPPPFVMVGFTNESNHWGTMTPTLRSLLVRRYKRTLLVSGSAFALGGSQALYEKRGSPLLKPRRPR